MDNDPQKGELQVEHYDAEAAAMKRKKILIRVGIGVGIATALGVLAYFGLTIGQDITGNPGWPMTEQIMGGNGAWFNSKLILLEDVDG